MEAFQSSQSRIRCVSVNDQLPNIALRSQNQKTNKREIYNDESISDKNCLLAINQLYELKHIPTSSYDPV